MHRVSHSTEGVIVLTEHCTERYEIVDLLPNSELSLQMVIISTMLMPVRFIYDGRAWRERLFKLPITSLFVVRNIKCWYVLVFLVRMSGTL